MAQPLPHVTFGGSGVKWLIDSGATKTLLKEKLSRKMPRLRITGKAARHEVHGLNASRKLNILPFIWKASGTPNISGYLIREHAAIGLLGYDGVIGLNTLVSSHAVMYPMSNRLRWNLNAGAYPSKRSVRLERHPNSGHLLARCRWQGESLLFLIDTGAARSLFSYESAQMKGVPVGKQTHLRVFGAHASKAAAFKMPPLLMSLGSEQGEVKRTATLIATDLRTVNRALSPSGDLKIDGILGYDFISRQCEFIDFGGRVMILARSHLKTTRSTSL
ncbi:MAG: hypothetical protein AB8F34_06575 [Akkermansiaceae bacterium]